MDFDDGNHGLTGWPYQAPGNSLEEPMSMDWSDQELISGFFSSDFNEYQSPARSVFRDASQQAYSAFSQQACSAFSQPFYQSISLPSSNWEHSGIISQAPIPTTPISDQSRLLTPLATPMSACYDLEETSLDPIAVSYSAFCAPQDHRSPVSHFASPPSSHFASPPVSHFASSPSSHFASPPSSHFASPPSSQPFEFTGIGGPASRFDFSYHSSPLTPDYPYDASAANSYFNHSYSELQHLNSPLQYPFLSSPQLQSPVRPAPLNIMGQESSQMAPPTENAPALSAPSKARTRVQQSPSPRGQSAAWNAINNPKDPKLPSPVDVSSPRRDQRKTKRKRVKEVTISPNPPRHLPKVKPTRAPPPPPPKSPSPSPSLSAASVDSPIAETSLQATSREQTPRSDASENLARSPMSSHESFTEESPTDGEAAPALKRLKISPAAARRQAPKSGVRTRASASGSPRSRASPPRPKPARRPTAGQQMNTGRYTDGELALLTEAVHAWRDDHDLTQAAMNDLVNSNARTNDFPGGLWDFICGVLPDRERHSVQKAVKRKFNNRKRGTWTPEDDEELCELYRMYQNQWQRIGEENNRGAEASRDRWRNYCKNGKAQQSGEWSPAEEKRLAQLMRDTVQVLVDQRMKDIKAGKSVSEHFDPAELMDFGILSEKMGGTRSRLQCRNKFEKFKTRESPNLAYIRKPADALDGLEFEVTTKEAGRKSKPKARLSTARMSEEAEALHNYNQKMLIGDKYYILTCISRALDKMPVDTDEESIPWDEIYERDDKTSWSILDRKTVLRQMQTLYPAPDDQTCLDVIEGITDILEADYDDEEREQFYVDRPRSIRKQRTYSKKGSRARNTISAIKISAEDDDDSPARSLPTPGSMEDDDDEEDGV